MVESYRAWPLISNHLPTLLDRRRGKARRGVIVPVQKRWPRVIILSCQIGVLVGIILFWEIAVRVGWIDPFFWSQPSAIWSAGVNYLSDWSSLYDVWYTVSATLTGFVVGTVIGAMIGLSFWWSANIAEIFEPYVIVSNSVPKIAFAPLLILIFGIGLASKIALSIVMTMIISILAAHSGVKAIDEDLIRMMYALGARRYQVFLKVVVPSALPWVISSMQINIGLALAGTIVGEFVSAQYGLGKLILYAGSTYDMALTWVGIIALSTTAVLMYLGVSRLERILLRGVHAQPQ
jgi:NitT/TauT family transport system permease protein